MTGTQDKPRSRKRNVFVALVAVGVLVVSVAIGGAVLFFFVRVSDGSRLSPSELDTAKKATVQILGMSASGAFVLTGSGAIISSDGLILTAAHVLEPDRDRESNDSPPSYFYIAVHDRDDRPTKIAFLAEPVASDAELDVAVMRIVAKPDGSAVEPEDLPEPLELGRSKNLERGDRVTAIGYPSYGDYDRDTMEAQLLVTDGRVSSVDDRGIASSTRVGPGSSGGPLLNNYGQLVGVVRQLGTPEGATTSTPAGPSGPYAFSTAAATARDVIDEARKADPSPGTRAHPVPDGSFHVEAAGWRLSDDPQCPGTDSLTAVAPGAPVKTVFVVEGVPNGTPYEMAFYDSASGRTLSESEYVWNGFKHRTCLHFGFTAMQAPSEIFAVLTIDLGDAADLGIESFQSVENPVVFR